MTNSPIGWNPTLLPLNKMQIIVDAGGTSCTWILIDNDKQVSQTETPAIHALLTPDNEILEVTELASHFFNKPKVKQIHFYGAGCINPETNHRLISLLNKIFIGAEISVNSDMLCAARALFADKPGIACILGTGSNSCLYNGTEIIENVSPLGFILGDEGSGAVLGKTLLGNILKKQFSPHICERFYLSYNISLPQIIENVYRRPAPNRFLASFTPFLKENIRFPEIEALVTEAFVSFLTRNVKNYTDASLLPVSFVGSVAWHFAPQLEKAVRLCNLNLGQIVQNPVNGITEFHLNRP